MDKSKEKLMAYVQVPENDSLLEHAYSSSGTESVHVQTGRRATHNWHRQRVHLLGAHLLNLILFATVAWLYFQPTDLYHQLSVFCKSTKTAKLPTRSKPRLTPFS